MRIHAKLQYPAAVPAFLPLTSLDHNATLMNCINSKQNKISRSAVDDVQYVSTLLLCTWHFYCNVCLNLSVISEYIFFMGTPICIEAAGQLQ